MKCKDLWLNFHKSPMTNLRGDFHLGPEETRSVCPPGRQKLQKLRRVLGAADTNKRVAGTASQPRRVN